jgi:hypothetical protein
MGFKEKIGGIIFVGLFAFCLVAFSVSLSIQNNANNSVLNDPSLTDFNDTIFGNLDTVEGVAQEQREVFEGQAAVGGQGEGFGLTSIISNVKTFFSLAIGTINLLFSTLKDTLGIPSIVLNVVFGVISISLLLLGWRVIKAGGT